eukprot:TRINITY_DN369_c0_g1_i5.p1 TRINITY_DN369_c0_g1~~TRINITY_DN369_c0_g1_i5.p1  ORF type:complete len:696 (+),score=241.33 TRINITY_DN369_c0_g1_i5:111-2090(+)
MAGAEPELLPQLLNTAAEGSVELAGQLAALARRAVQSEAERATALTKVRSLERDKEELEQRVSHAESAASRANENATTEKQASDAAQAAAAEAEGRCATLSAELAAKQQALEDTKAELSAVRAVLTENQRHIRVLMEGAQNSSANSGGEAASWPPKPPPSVMQTRVEVLFGELGIPQFADLMLKEDIEDIRDLWGMTWKELQELGLPIGHAARVLRALKKPGIFPICGSDRAMPQQFVGNVGMTVPPKPQRPSSSSGCPASPQRLKLGAMPPQPQPSGQQRRPSLPAAMPGGGQEYNPHMQKLPDSPDLDPSAADKGPLSPASLAKDFLPMIEQLDKLNRPGEQQLSEAEWKELGVTWCVPVAGQLYDLVPNGRDISVPLSEKARYCALARTKLEEVGSTSRKGKMPRNMTISTIDAVPSKAQKKEERDAALFSPSHFAQTAAPVPQVAAELDDLLSPRSHVKRFWPMIDAVAAFNTGEGRRVSAEEFAYMDIHFIAPNPLDHDEVLELFPGGKNIQVTLDRKDEFVQLARMLYHEKIAEQRSGGGSRAGSRATTGVKSRRWRALDLLPVAAVAAAAVYHAALPWGDRLPFLPLLALSAAGGMAVLWGLALAANVFSALLAGAPRPLGRPQVQPADGALRRSASNRNRAVIDDDSSNVI